MGTNLQDITKNKEFLNRLEELTATPSDSIKVVPPAKKLVNTNKLNAFLQANNTTQLIDIPESIIGQVLPAACWNCITYGEAATIASKLEGSTWKAIVIELIKYDISKFFTSEHTILRHPKPSYSMGQFVSTFRSSIRNAYNIKEYVEDISLPKLHITPELRKFCKTFENCLTKEYASHNEHRWAHSVITYDKKVPCKYHEQLLNLLEDVYKSYGRAMIDAEYPYGILISCYQPIFTLIWAQDWESELFKNIYLQSPYPLDSTDFRVCFTDAFKKAQKQSVKVTSHNILPVETVSHAEQNLEITQKDNSILNTQTGAGESLKILGLENQLYNITREKENLEYKHTLEEHKHNLELIKLKGALEGAQMDNDFLKFWVILLGVLVVIQFLFLVFVAVKFTLI